MAVSAPHDQSGTGSRDVAPGERGRQQPRARATRLAILNAAADHFARYGYHATSLDRVLADSGGTKGALYFHFASKQALASAVIAEMVQRWAHLRSEVAQRGLDPLTALLALMDEVIARLIHSPIARGGTRLITEAPWGRSEAAPHFALGEQDALALLREAHQAGLLVAGVEPAVVARQLVALLAGHRQVCDTQGAREEIWIRVDEAWSFLLPAIATPDWLAGWRASGWACRPRPVIDETLRDGM